MGLVGFIFLKDWAELVMEGREVVLPVDFWTGGILLSGSIILSLCMHLIVKRKM